MLVERVTDAPIDYFKRPSPESFKSLTPEFFRWYDEHRNHRSRPLDFDELVRFLMGYEGCTFVQAEFAAYVDSDAGLIDRLMDDVMD